VCLGGGGGGDLLEQLTIRWEKGEQMLGVGRKRSGHEGTSEEGQKNAVEKEKVGREQQDRMPFGPRLMDHKKGGPREIGQRKEGESAVAPSGK